MSKVIGNTIGTPYNPDLRMENAEKMSIISELDVGDSFVIFDVPGKRHVKISWKYLREIIKSYLNGTINSKGVVDENTGYVAKVPDLEANAVLALVSDITDALAEYYKKSETYTRTDIDRKMETVINNTQPKGDYLISADLSGHDTSNESHNDIRLLISELSTAVRNFLDVDDTTKDQLSEVIALIQANATDIEKITNGKINVSDIVDNLTTKVVDRPLSAYQGAVLKELIDALSSGKLDTATFNSTIANFYNKSQTETYVQGYAQPKGDYQPAGNYVSASQTITITGVDENGVTHTWTVYGVKV